MAFKMNLSPYSDEELDKKVREGRENGLSFARLKDIPANAGHRLEGISVKEGHVHKFKKAESRDEIRVYRCVEPASKCFAQAYHCPRCDYVPGEPDEIPFDDMSVPLAGSKGVNYSCRICGTRLGTRVDMVS